MSLTKEQRQELLQAQEDMRTYAMTLPVGSEERLEFEDAIAQAGETLKTYGKTSQPTDSHAPDPDPDEDDQDEAAADEDEDEDEAPKLNTQTESSLAELADMLRAEGYDVGDDTDDLVRDTNPRSYSRAPDDEAAQLYREDIDERVDALVIANKLLPFEANQAKVALYALMDATPVGGAVGGLRTYSRDEQGNTPTTDRRAAVRDLITVLAGRDEVGLTRTYTREQSEGDVPISARLTLNVPSDVAINEQSAQLANAINALAQERGLTFAQATKIYEREKGKVTLKRY